MTVTRTTLVNGSVFSSQAFSRSCSAETTAPSLRISTSRTANSLGASWTSLPSRKTSRRLGSSLIPARSRTGGSGTRRTAAEGTHAGGQLAEGERLGQVVVGADLQALDTVADVAGGGEHQHAGGHAQLDDLAADVVAVHEREVAVEDDHVVVVDADAFQGGRAVVHDVDGHGLPAQSGGHRIGEQLLVLDDEYAHVACPSSVHPRSAHGARGQGVHGL